MIEDQPGRGESEEAGVIRERSIKDQDQKDQDHSGRVMSDDIELTEEENEPEKEFPERGSDRKKKQPGRGTDRIEDQPGRGESREPEIQRAR